MTVREIVLKYLKGNGYDGLCNSENCSCDVDGLIRCSGNSENCEAGYKMKCKGCDEIDYCISPDKNDKCYYRD